MPGRSRLYAAAEKSNVIHNQLARTDRLIDRVVYRLYGLTDDQIAKGKKEDEISDNTPVSTDLESKRVPVYRKAPFSR
jgi:hypothetical protein